jgi:hypothetical protein
MKPEQVELNTRVSTPDGSGRVMPFFKEDPDLVVCQAPNKPRKILCLVKLDDSNEEKEYDVQLVEFLQYT